MHTLDRVGLVIGSVVAGISLLSWAIVDIDDNIRIMIGIGGVIIIGFSVLWPKIKKQKSTPQYDAKKLNETVYKKLMRVSCFYSIFLFGDKLGFGIPKDDIAFYDKNSGDYQIWMMDTNDTPKAELYYSLKSVIPNLNIGEKYLEQNYNDIYKEWMKIKQTVEEHNKKYEDFEDHLGEMAVQEISRQFPTFKDHTEVDIYANVDVYFLKNVKRNLARFIKHNQRAKYEEPPFDKIIRFDDLFVSKSRMGNYWVLDHSRTNGDSLMAGPDKDRLDAEKLQKILNSIIEDPKNTELFIKSKDYDMGLHDKIDAITKKLEAEVVHDIENQL